MFQVVKTRDTRSRKGIPLSNDHRALPMVDCSMPRRSAYAGSRRNFRRRQPGSVPHGGCDRFPRLPSRVFAPSKPIDGQHLRRVESDRALQQRLIQLRLRRPQHSAIAACRSHSNTSALLPDCRRENRVCREIRARRARVRPASRQRGVRASLPQNRAACNRRPRVPPETELRRSFAMPNRKAARASSQRCNFASANPARKSKSAG